MYVKKTRFHVSFDKTKIFVDHFISNTLSYTYLHINKKANTFESG